MKQIDSLTIAIPAYNEEGSIKKVVKDAYAAGRSIARHIEILIVDDGSTDHTGAIADTLATKNRTIKVIHHPDNLGFSGAIKTCYKYATKKFVFLLPADGQIAAKDCERFIKETKNADVIVGYRSSNPEPFSRRLNSWVFHRIYRLLFGVTLREISTSILWRTSVLKKINISAVPRSAVIEPEVIYKAWKAGFRFAEVPVPFYLRKTGKAKGNNPVMILFTIKEIMRLWLTERVFAPSK